VVHRLYKMKWTPDVRALLGSLAIVCLLSACGNKLVVRTTSDGTTDVAGYETFNFLKKDHGQFLSEVGIRRVRHELGKGMVSRGYRYDPGATPDVVVHYYLYLSKQTRVVETPAYYTAISSGAFVTSSADSTTDREGTLIVDLIDQKTHKHVWRGQATVVSDDYSEAKKLMLAGIQELISRIPKRRQ